MVSLNRLDCRIGVPYLYYQVITIDCYYRLRGGKAKGLTSFSNGSETQQTLKFESPDPIETRDGLAFAKPFSFANELLANFR
jgi:hypothetical protein